jgi:hypothetical protein
LAIEGVGAKVFACHGTLGDELAELLRRLTAAGIERSLTVEASLIRLRGIETVKAEITALDNKRIGILMRAGPVKSAAAALIDPNEKSSIVIQTHNRIVITLPRRNSHETLAKRGPRLGNFP